MLQIVLCPGKETKLGAEIDMNCSSLKFFLFQAKKTQPLTWEEKYVENLLYLYQCRYIFKMMIIWRNNNEL